MLTDLNKKGRNFRNQMGICAIICWVFTIFVVLEEPDKLGDWIIVPLCAIAYTLIWLKMFLLIRRAKRILKNILS